MPIWAAVAMLLGSIFAAGGVRGATFRVERVASGLDKPVFVTQAPGDYRTLYLGEEFTDDVTGFGDRSRILAQDLASGVHTTLLTLDEVDWRNEGGLKTMAFHPDYQTNGIYYVGWVQSAEAAGSNRPHLRIDEYVVSEGTSALNRILLSQPNRRSVTSHSINWIGFDPTATGAARDYLYVTIGDGGYQAEDDEFVNVSQDLSSIHGKVLRLDLAAPDAYPEDPNRNYGYPADNPFAQDNDPQTLGEVLHSGLRNPWRASFDRQTGDLYISDVGNHAAEEINFAKAGSAGLDFGWPAREGTLPNPVSIHAGPQGASINPMLQHLHGDGYVSITGGQIYRGVIDELEGQYFYGEASVQRINAARFDRDIDPALFDGTNFTDLKSWRFELNGLIPGGGDINRPVSFNEDHAGNLYIVDHTTAGLFGTTLNLGEVFRLVPLHGDFDGDGTIDGLDYQQWQADLGADPAVNGPRSDADDDGRAGGTELLVWQREISPAVDSLLTRVPEPSSAMLWALGAGIAAGRRRCVPVRTY
jgi:glucose/arabinose dehydrogenase